MSHRELSQRRILDLENVYLTAIFRPADQGIEHKFKRAVGLNPVLSTETYQDHGTSAGSNRNHGRFCQTYSR